MWVDLVIVGLLLVVIGQIRSLRARLDRASMINAIGIDTNTDLLKMVGDFDDEFVENIRRGYGVVAGDRRALEEWRRRLGTQPPAKDA